MLRRLAVVDLAPILVVESAFGCTDLMTDPTLKLVVAQLYFGQ